MDIKRKILIFLKPTWLKLFFSLILLLLNLMFGLGPSDVDFYLAPIWQQNVSKFFAFLFYGPFFLLNKYNIVNSDNFSWSGVILFEGLYIYLLSCLSHLPILWLKNKI